MLRAIIFLYVCNTALGLYATLALLHLPGIDSRRKHTQRLDTGLNGVFFAWEVSRNLAPYWTIEDKNSEILKYINQNTTKCPMGGLGAGRVKKSERAVHRHQNELVHSIVHQAVIQHVQFTFTKIINEFMNRYKWCASRERDRGFTQQLHLRIF